MSLLNRVSESGEIKKLNIKELVSLSEEIRRVIIDGAYQNGGHLSANLGVIELTVALHYVFDFESDKLIFDVGHQCYTHKILTGRLKDFDKIRKEDGLSGFPSIEESKADAFSSGHAGTAIGAGIGYAEARDLLGDNYKVISLVGDASFTNGVSSEALMSLNEKPKNFIVILNDNGMAISQNTNGMYKAISKMTTKSRYEKFKKGIKKVFGHSFITKGLIGIRDFIRRILNKNSYFDNLGFKYIGVIDGHDMKELVKTLKLIKNTQKPVLLHVRTVKGKGFNDAEKQAERFHGVGKGFCESKNDFSKALGDKLVELREKDNKLHAIVAGMTDGTGLTSFAEKFPRSFTDVGISEEYAVTLASGMALGGIKPVVCIYSTFLQRAYDQILHDVCLQNLGVVFCLDRAGVVGADGQTHQGVFDLSYLSSLPNMTVLAPKDTAELSACLDYAFSLGTPVAVRYPNGKDFTFPKTDANISKFEKLTDGDVCVLAVGGRMLSLALEVSKKSSKKIMVVNARTVKPLDGEFLDSVANLPIITLEENVINGGFGSNVATYFSRKGKTVNLTTLGIDNAVIKQAQVSRQLEKQGLSEQNLMEIIDNL